jgi:hypothetical protein
MGRGAVSLCGLTRCLGRPRCAASLTTEGLQLLQSHVGYMKGALESLQSKIGERYLAPPSPWAKPHAQTPTHHLSTHQGANTLW